jgi:hypothetical protein
MGMCDGISDALILLIVDTILLDLVGALTNTLQASEYKKGS